MTLVVSSKQNTTQLAVELTEQLMLLCHNSVVRNSAQAQTAKFEIEFDNVIQSERGGISASDNTQRPQAMGYLVLKVTANLM